MTLWERESANRHQRSDFAITQLSFLSVAATPVLMQLYFVN
jgi:hypothetical protein